MKHPLFGIASLNNTGQVMVRATEKQNKIVRPERDWKTQHRDVQLRKQKTVPEKKKVPEDRKE